MANNNINIQDIPDGDNKDFYKSFREKLHDVEQFPSMYTFKFIVKSNLNKESEIEKVFEHPSSKFSYKDSSGGKYKSITVETFVNNPDEVIDYYKAVSEIESVIML